MNGIQIFQNEQFGQVRIAMSESREPLFCLSDVCSVIGIANARNVRARLDSEDVHQMDTLTDGGTQQVTFVTEPGLYDVIIRSDSERARPFRKWVTGEVLPSIRKHGAYMITSKEDTPEEIMAKAVMYAQAKIAEQANAIDNLEEVNKLQHKQLVISAPKVAYYDAAMESNSTYSTTMIAKDLGMDAAKLNSILKNLGIQYKQAGTWYLYSKYQGNGYTRVIPRYFTHSDGTPGNSPQTRWTEKGREFILNLRKENKL